MSTLVLTSLQQRILSALSSTTELSNAQVAEAAGCGESYASVVLSRLARAGLASSREVQDTEDRNIRWRLWKRGPGAVQACPTCGQSYRPWKRGTTG